MKIAGGPHHVRLGAGRIELRMQRAVLCSAQHGWHHRSALPVSKQTDSGWAGVPMLISP